MNCHEFEKLINDLACDNLMTVNQRAQAWAHKENCGRCAARLAEERLLTERLRLVASLDVEQAPARVKTALLAAFSERAATSGQASLQAAKLSTAPNHSFASLAPMNKPSSHRSRWIWAAAAAVILFAAITTVRLLNSQSVVETPPNAPQTLANDSGKPEAQQPATSVTPPDGTQQKEQVVTVISPSKETQPTAGRNDGKIKPQPAMRIATNPKSRKAEDTLIAANNNRNEVVTDYIPLTYLSNATALDSGLVVRVQMPRSTLISMGLPMNVESSKELIKADVVVGDDGVARAIRFVHDVSDRTDGKQAK
jgi:hypothetical protein